MFDLNDTLRTINKASVRIEKNTRAMKDTDRKALEIALFADSHLPAEPKITHIIVKDEGREYHLKNKAWVATKAL